MKEDHAHESDSYQANFLAFSDRIEMALKRLILLFVALLIISQLLLQVPGIRWAVNEVERLEGVPFEHPASLLEEQ